MLFSILIPSLVDRREMFLTSLLEFLDSQADEYPNEVEVLTYIDDGRVPTGTKRNALIHRARGKFVAFIDDDDWVSDTYVKDVVQAVKQNPDLHCVGFFGELYFRTKFGGLFVHSIMCKEWTEKRGWYYRPPNHLNPIRRDLIWNVGFKPIVVSEDHFWSLDVKKSGRITNEVFLGGKPTYIYRCREEKKGL